MKQLEVMMKTTNLFLMMLIMVFLALTGCDDNGYYVYDNTPPSPPRNVWTVTGDNRVDIFWDHNTESDVIGYNVYYNSQYEGRYTLLGSTEDNSFIDYGAENAVTTYYAVAAYDDNGNESELSYDVVYDTPRPEGFNQAIFDYSRFPGTSGYDLSDYLVRAYDDDGSDFFFEIFEGVPYLNVWEDTDLIDMGSTYDLYDISYAPDPEDPGWIQLLDGDNVKYIDIYPGSTYVVWTWDNHFAKIRVRSVTSERMVFDWAYQLVEGERELKEGRISRAELPAKMQKNYGSLKQK